jgi:hypothetical protein
VQRRGIAPPSQKALDVSCMTWFLARVRPMWFGPGCARIGSVCADTARAMEPYDLKAL